MKRFSKVNCLAEFLGKQNGKLPVYLTGVSVYENMIALFDLCIDVYIELESVLCYVRSWGGGWERSAGGLEILELD